MSRSTKQFPFLQLEGPAREVGRGHGEAFGERINSSLALYEEEFHDRGGLAWSEALVRAARIGEQINRRAPELMEEMAGIAEACDQPLDAIVALNARLVLMRSKAEPTPSDAECTTGTVLPGATADGHTYHFANWDGHPNGLDTAVILEIRIPGRPAILVITQAGIMMLRGLNEHGIGLTGNALISDRDGGGTTTIPTGVLRRQVLWHTGISPAVRELASAPSTISSNHMIGSAEGYAIDCEQSPIGVFQVTPVDDILVHTNHFVHPGAQAKLGDLLVGRSPSSLYRRDRVDQALRAHHGAITAETIQDALRDHLGRPESVCSHPHGAKGGLTVASHVSDLTARTMSVTVGPPCENEYHTYRLQ